MLISAFISENNNTNLAGLFPPAPLENGQDLLSGPSQSKLALSP